MSARTALYRRLIGYLRSHVPALLVGSALAIVVAAMEGRIAWLVKPAMDDVFIRRDVAMLRLIPLLFVVVHEGRIAEVGRHDELLARDGLYRRLYALRMEGVTT